jgi:hypothetical protein
MTDSCTSVSKKIYLFMEDHVSHGSTCQDVTNVNSHEIQHSLICKASSGILGEGARGGFEPSKKNFQSFDKAQYNSQFRGIYIRNDLIRI